MRLKLLRFIPGQTHRHHDPKGAKFNYVAEESKVIQYRVGGWDMDINLAGPKYIQVLVSGKS